MAESVRGTHSPQPKGSSRRAVARRAKATEFTATVQRIAAEFVASESNPGPGKDLSDIHPNPQAWKGINEAILCEIGHRLAEAYAASLK